MNVLTTLHRDLSAKQQRAAAISRLSGRKNQAFFKNRLSRRTWCATSATTSSLSGLDAQYRRKGIIPRPPMIAAYSAGESIAAKGEG